MFAAHPKRLKTFSYVGLHRYFLTFCTYRRQPYFRAHEVVALAVEQMLRAAQAEQFEILAYCFMPDHLHLLVEGQTEQADGRRFISKAKQYTAYYYSRRFGGWLWQRYGYEHVLRGDEATLSVARYIVENPVRGGLVMRVDEYPFVGSSRYSLAEILDAVAMRPRVD